MYGSHLVVMIQKLDLSLIRRRPAVPHVASSLQLPCMCCCELSGVLTASTGNSACTSCLLGGSPMYRGPQAS